MMSQGKANERFSVWQRLRLSRVGVALALIAFLVLGGTGAYAFWSTTASTSTTVKAGTLAVTTSWSTSVGKIFTNDSYSKTGEFTVKNTTSTTSSVALPYTVNLGFTGTATSPLTSNVNLTVWKKGTASGSTCAAAVAPIYTGTWGTPPAGIKGNLLAGSSDIWCILTAASERSALASTTGTASLVPTVSATITAGSNWTKTSVTASDSEQKAVNVFSALTPSANWYRVRTSVSGRECSDVRGNGGSGTDVIAYSCNVPGSGNQILKFTPTDTGYVKIAFKYNVALQVGVAGGVTTVGSSVQVQSTETTDGSQEWQLQSKGSGIYQIVNRKSGLCMEPDPADTPATPVFKQRVCSGAALQQFTLEQWENPAFVTFQCTNTPRGVSSTSTLRLDWTGQLQDDVTVQVRQNSTGAWQDNGTAAIGDSSYTIKDRATLITWDHSKAHEYRVVGAWGTVLATGSFRALQHTWEMTDWSTYDYLRCGT